MAATEDFGLGTTFEIQGVISDKGKQHLFGKRCAILHQVDEMHFKVRIEGFTVYMGRNELGGSFVRPSAEPQASS